MKGQLSLLTGLMICGQLICFFGSPVRSTAQPMQNSRQVGSYTPANSPDLRKEAQSTLGPYFTRLERFGIPINIDESQDLYAEVQLFVSLDRGATWNLYRREYPRSSEVEFTANGDGEYWFALSLIDRNNQAHPPANQLVPEMIIAIDREKPDLEFDVQVDPTGVVHAKWSARDPLLVPESFKLEYRSDVFATAAQPQWASVSLGPAPRAPNGEFSHSHQWRPDVNALSLVVRAEIKDRAENVTVVQRQLKLPKVASGIRAMQVSNTRQSGTQPPAASDPFARKPPAYQVDDSVPWSSSPADPRADQQRWTNTQQTITHSQFPAQENQSLVSSTQPMAQGFQPSGVRANNAVVANSIESNPPQQRGNVTEKRPTQFVSESGANGAGEGRGLESTKSTELPPGQFARLSNTNRFKLSYEVDSIGPSGVGKVELWITKDSGRSWQIWGVDTDNQSPFPVEVQGDGLYGFRIVVSSQDGLSGKAPVAGDVADIWIDVDLVKPEAAIISTPYGRGPEAGHLIVNWTASDERLAPRPITIKYAIDPQGPWEIIATGLPNNGSYPWRIDPHTPKQVFVRLEVADRAGNVQVSQLTQPVDLSGMSPKGTIRGFEPSSSNTR